MTNRDGPRFRRRRVARDPPDPVSIQNRRSPAVARSRETPDRPVCRRRDFVQSRDLSEPTIARHGRGILPELIFRIIRPIEVVKVKREFSGLFWALTGSWHRATGATWGH